MKNKIIYIEYDKDDFLALKNVLKSNINDIDLVWVNSLQSLLELKVVAENTLFIMLDYQFEELSAKNLIQYFKEIAIDIEIVILTKYQEDKIYNTFKNLGINHIFNKNEMENLLQFVLEKKVLKKNTTLVNEQETGVLENFKTIEYYDKLIPNNYFEKLYIETYPQLLINQNFQIIAFNQSAKNLFENNLKNGEDFLKIIDSKLALLITDKIQNFNNDSVSIPYVIKDVKYEMNIKSIEFKSKEKIHTISFFKNNNNIQTESLYKDLIKNTKLLIENSKSIIFQLNKKGEVIYLSDSYKNITGFEKADVLYKPLGILQDSNVQENVKNVLIKLAKGEITEATDYITVKTKDKKTIYLRYRIESIINEHGNFNGVYGVFTDVSEVIEASKALKKTEDSLELIINNLYEVIFLIDNKLRITFITPSILEITGFLPEDIIGKRFIDFVHPDDYGNVNTYIKNKLPLNKLNENGESILTRFKKKNNLYIYIETTIKKIKNKDNEKPNYIGSSRYVDEKINAEIILKEKKKYLEIITEIQNFYIITKYKKKTFDYLLKRLIVNTNIDFGFVSLVFTDENGNPYIQSNEFTTITFNQTFDSSDKIDEIIVDELKNIQPLLERVLNEKQLIKWDYIVNDKLIDKMIPILPITQKFVGIPIFSNNKILAVLGFSSKQEEYATDLVEKLQPILSVLVSIIEQNKKELKIKKTQLQLEKSEAKVKAILNSMEEIIFEINHEFIISNIWSKNIEKMTIPAEELINIKISSLIGHVNFNQNIYDNLILLSQDGITRKMEYSLNSKEGIIWKSANLYLLSQEPEKVYCIQINDITIFKNAEANLKQNLIHEKELTELKSRFVTLTSHEFRTPLTSISTSNELISMLLKKSEIPINAQLEKYINNIQNQVKHMTDLVNDVIKIGKIDANKMVLNLINLNLKEAVDEVIENLLFTHKIPRKIKTNVKGEPFSIMMDFNALEHILENIINNAFKYSPNRPDPILEIDFQSSEIIFTLQDFGIGIPKQDQPLLFEHFYRASNVGKIEGVGLGLVIVKNLVNQLQGNLKIDSEEDKGTRIEITFYKNN